MKSSYTTEEALAFTKFSIMLTAIWPPDRDIDGLKLKLINTVWFLAVLSPMCLLIPLLISIQVYINDPIILSKSICLSVATSQIIIKSTVCRFHWKKLQFLLNELQDFLRTAGRNETILLQECVNQHAGFHIKLTILCYGASFIVICGPLVSPDLLPTEAVYPFSVNSSPIWELAYIHQSYVAFQCSASMCIDCLIALLLWYTGLRFELLYDKLKNVSCLEDMHECIREHQLLLRYGKELSDTFRYVTLTTVTSVAAGIVFAGVYMFTPQPLFVKGQFLGVCTSAAINLYVTAKPCDNLIVMCEKFTDVPFETLWIDETHSITRNWIMVVQRAQKPIIIGIPGLIKELSLQFYFSVMSSTFSYFTALRVIMVQEE